MSRLLSISITKLDLMAFNGNLATRFKLFSRNDLSRIRYKAYVIIFDDKKVNELIGFRYLLTEIQLNNMILLELNIFLKKC